MKKQIKPTNWTTDMSRATPNGLYVIDEDDYHGDPFKARPSLSSTMAKLIEDRSPMHAFMASRRCNPPEDDAGSAATKFDLGSAAHSLILHKGKKIKRINAPDKRSADTKEEIEEARRRGFIPLLAHEYDKAKTIAMAFNEQITAFGLSYVFGRAYPELAAVFDLEGAPCRGLLDKIYIPKKGEKYQDIYVFDLKTTGVNGRPDHFIKHAINMGYDIQRALYMEGLKTLFPDKNIHWMWIVVETQEPYPISIICAPDAMEEIGRAKALSAASIWGHCLDSNSFPSYPQRIIRPPLPSYYMSQFDQKQTYRLGMTHQYGSDPSIDGVKTLMSLEEQDK